MKLQDKFKLAKYITGKTGADYAWGTNDCNTFLFEFHDYAYGTNLMSLCKYRTKDQAREFSRNYMSVNQWMNIHDYKEIKGKNPKWQEGDVVVHSVYDWMHIGYIYHNGAFWTMTEKGLNNYTPKVINKIKTNAWRKIDSKNCNECNEDPCECKE
jgi:hypothetical protein